MRTTPDTRTYLDRAKQGHGHYAICRVCKTGVAGNASQICAACSYDDCKACGKSFKKTWRNNLRRCPKCAHAFKNAQQNMSGAFA